MNIKFTVKERCRTEGTRVQLKGDYNTYIYMGMSMGDEENNYKVHRILKHADYKDTTLKIVENEEYLDKVYLDFSCLDNLKALQEELEKDYGFNSDPDKFFKNFSLFKENYSKIKDDNNKSAFSTVYRQYEEGLKKSILEAMEKEFETNKDEVKFISSIVLDLVFNQFIFPIYIDDMEKNKNKE